MAESGITWPEDLPQSFMIDGYDESPQGITIRTSMDAALPKQRPRFSTTTEQIQGNLLMTTAEYIVFKAFYKEDLANGTLMFNFPDINGDMRVVQFRDKYKPQFVFPFWIVTLPLEEVP